MYYEEEEKDKREYNNRNLQKKKKVNRCIFIIVLSLIVVIQFTYFSSVRNSQETRFKFYKKCSTAKEAVDMYIEKGWGDGWNNAYFSEDSRGCLHPIYSMSDMFSISKFTSRILMSNFKLDDISYYHSFEILTENNEDKDEIDELEYYIKNDVKQVVEQGKTDFENVKEYNAFLSTHNFEIKNAKKITGKFFTSRSIDSKLDVHCHKFGYVNFSCDVVEWENNWYVLKFEIERYDK